MGPKSSNWWAYKRKERDALGAGRVLVAVEAEVGAGPPQPGAAKDPGSQERPERTRN